MGSAWIATMLTVPQTRTTSVTARAAAGLPVTSKATSTPSPPVQLAVKRDTSMSGPTVVRPNDSSSATRNGFTSATATSAPRWRAPSAISAPIGPPPQTTTRSPPARRAPAPRGRLHALAERLVPDHAAPRHAVVEVPLVDVQVGAADPDALDAHERLARLRHRPGRRARRERARTLIE